MSSSEAEEEHRLLRSADLGSFAEGFLVVVNLDKILRVFPSPFMKGS